MKKNNSLILVLVTVFALNIQMMAAQPLFNIESLNEKGYIHTNSLTSFKFEPYLLSFDNSISSDVNNYLQHRRAIHQVNAEMEMAKKREKTLADLNNDIWNVDEEEEDMQMENWMLDPNEWLSTN